MKQGREYPDYRIFGNNLRKYRKQKNLTQKELGQRVGVHQGSISNIEQGKKHVTSRLEMALARELGVSVSDLWKEV